MKMKPFTTPDGAEHPYAVWLPMLLGIDHTQRTARVIFYGYHDASTLTAGRRPLTGAVKEYIVSDPADYAALVGQPPPPGTTLLDSVATACYALAAARLDTIDPEHPSGPLVSFFHGCPDA